MARCLLQRLRRADRSPSSACLRANRGKGIACGSRRHWALVSVRRHGYEARTIKVIGVRAPQRRGPYESESQMASVLNSDKDGEKPPKSTVTLPADYRPSPDEEFMNPLQLEYFRQRLWDWKKQILAEAEGTLAVLQNEPLREPDLNDRASSETDWSIELRTRDRQRKLISKIDAALRRIDEGEYGYCEVTGEPISLGRLEARPIATMTVEAQERHERQEKISRDD